MTTALYKDPTFDTVLHQQVQDKKCKVCEHQSPAGCARGYTGFYQCRQQDDGFRLREDK